MNRNIWVSSIAALVVALSSVCSADSNVPPARGADPHDAYSAAAFYDLGNSYARQGEPALAVLNYERALMLAPRDPDIRANLRRERELAGLAPEAPSWSDELRWAPPNTSYWIGVAGLLLAGVGWLLLSLRPSYRLLSRSVIGSGLFLVAFTITDALATERFEHQFVVLHSVAASASPVSGADPAFTVPAASVVDEQDEHASFSLIRNRQGSLGWVPRSQLVPIIDSPSSAGRG